MKKMRVITAVLSLLIFSAIRGQRADTIRQSLTGNAVRKNAVSLTYDPAIYDAGGAYRFDGSFRVRTYNNFITLELPSSHPEAFNYEIRIRFVVTRKKLQQQSSDSSFELIVRYDNTAGSSYRAKNGCRFSDAAWVKLRIDSVRISKNGIPLSADQTDYTRLLSGITVQNYICRLLSYRNHAEELPLIRENEPDGRTASIRLNWQEVSWADEYQLEWTFVNAYDDNFSRILPRRGIPLPDWRFNSTRVSISDTFYAVPAIYERGHLLYRVRAIAHNSFENNDIFYGDWYFPMHFFPESRNTVEDVAGNAVTDFRLVQVFQGDKMNWQYMASYADNGKRRDMVTFMDGTLRQRQTVTRQNSDTITMASQVIYDHQGRPAVNTLLSPVLRSSAEGVDFYIRNLSYQPGLDRDNEGHLYDRSDFDTDPQPATCQAVRAEPIGNGSGASRYFSPANPDKQNTQAFIPDAEGYPFSRTIWTDDNTSRVLYQSAPGKEFRIGSGHETKYDYSTPSQSELDALFGNDAGDANHYRKTVLTDPNGQQYLQYKTLEGKLVATALAGNAPAALDQLGGDGTFIALDFLHPGNAPSADGLSLQSNSFISISTDGTDVRFNYNFTPPVLTKLFCQAGTPFCTDCRYHLQIEIRNSCGEIQHSFSRQVGGIDDICRNPGNGLTIDTFSLRLGKGVYAVSRTLRVDTSSFDQFFRQVMADSSCTVLHPDFDRPEDIHITCHSTCGECEALLKRARDDVQKEQLKLICAGICGGTSLSAADLAKMQMLSDLSPGGQYALWRDQNPGENENASFPYQPFDLSVVNENSAHKLLGNNLADWKNPVTPYRDPDGRESVMLTYVPEIGDVPMAPQNSFWVSDFITNWKNSWAQSLLPYHPEYPYWRYYDSADRTSRTFIHEKNFREKLMRVTAMSQALPAGYLDLVGNPAKLDSAVYFLAVADRLKYKLGHYYPKPGGNGYYTLKEFVYITGRCAYFDVTSGSLQHCLDNAVTANLGHSGSRILDDRDWTTFRALYIKERNRLIDSVIRDYIVTRHYFVNDCIGDPYFLEHRVTGNTNDPPSTELYFGKQKRFPTLNNAYDGLDIELSGDESTDAQRILDYVNWKMYEKCSRCPVAANLEAVMNMAAYYKKLDKSFWLNREIPLPPVLMNALGATDTVSWKGTVGQGRELRISLRTSRNGNKCDIFLKPQGTAAELAQFNWNKIIFLNCLTQADHSSLFPQTPAENTFIVTGYDSLFNKYTIEGYSTCFNIRDCDPPSYCNTSCAGGSYFALLKIALEARPGTRRMLITDKEVSYRDLTECLIQKANSMVDSVVYVPGQVIIYYRYRQIIQLAGRPITGFRTVKDSCRLIFNSRYANSRAVSVTLLGIEPVRQKKDACNESGLLARLRISYKDSVRTDSLWVSADCAPVLSCCREKENKTCSNLVTDPDFQKAVPAFNTDLIDKKIFQCLSLTDTRDLTNCINHVLAASGQKRLVTGRDLSDLLETAGITLNPAGVPARQNPANIFSYPLLDGKRNLFAERLNRKMRVWWQQIKINTPGIHHFSVEVEWTGGTTPAAADLSGLFLVTVDGHQSNTPVTSKMNDNGMALLETELDISGFGQMTEFALWYTASNPRFNNNNWYLRKFKLVPAVCSGCCIPLLPPIPLQYHDSCELQIDLLADYYREKNEKVFYDSLRNALKREYINRCLQAQEHFTASYTDNIYQYTLYYYDLPGNLVKTVPPAGVRLLGTDQLQAVQATRQANGNPLYPTHTMVSVYRYNSLDQVTQSETPDGGLTRNWYDRLGRIFLSQQARQIPLHKYAYKLYDKLGRTLESGEVHRPVDFTSAELAGFRINQDLLVSILAVSQRNEVILNCYDEPVNPQVSGYFANGQQFLRKRIASLFVADSLAPGLTPLLQYYSATHFNYDIHGNVNELVQEIPELAAYGQRTKHIRYEYEAATGLVTKTLYQEHQPDQFLHRYCYDADNRLLSLYTSTDEVWWDTDAQFRYYKHGSLAREELGAEHIQGLDYAYTLQGWLKSVNGNSTEAGRDMGQDGTNGSAFARDVFGFSAGYYSGDYNSIQSFTPANYFLSSGNNPALGQKNLYNGNIAYIISAISGLVQNPVQAALYSYDQLNRLTGMRVSRPGAGESWLGTDEYLTRLRYDLNGNITRFFRNGTTAGHPLAMDDLQYEYQPGTNMLVHVKDVISPSNYENDVDQQPAGNYSYDESGNLTGDRTEGLNDIRWSPRGKIRNFNKGDRLSVVYSYDALGQRYKKSVGNKTTYYIRDAKANILAIYEVENSALTQKLLTINGGARIGVYHVPVAVPGNAVNTELLRGLRNYELKNQLGDIQVVVSDRKIIAGSLVSADLLAAYDYYPFGMQMPQRSLESGNYPFGIQGKLREDDMSGTSNRYDFENRFMDSRLGRWMSIDPLATSTPGLSPYNAMGNNPIRQIDPEGLADVPYNAGIRTDETIEVDGTLFVKYIAEKGTWVSAAAKNEGTGYSKESGYGAYHDIVLGSDLVPLLNPDLIEPGDVFYIPVQTVTPVPPPPSEIPGSKMRNWDPRFGCEGSMCGIGFRQDNDKATAKIFRAEGEWDNGPNAKIGMGDFDFKIKDDVSGNFEVFTAKATSKWDVSSDPTKGTGFDVEVGVGATAVGGGFKVGDKKNGFGFGLSIGEGAGLGLKYKVMPDGSIERGFKLELGPVSVEANGTQSREEYIKKQENSSKGIIRSSKF